MLNKIIEYIIPAVIVLIACIGLTLCCVIAMGGALNAIGYIKIIL